MTAKLISQRLRDMALRYDYEDRPLLIEAATALERHLLNRLEQERDEADRSEPKAPTRFQCTGCHAISNLAEEHLCPEPAGDSLPKPNYFMSGEQIHAIRDAALEECAKIADTYRGVSDAASCIANHIRSLDERATSQREGAG